MTDKNKIAGFRKTRKEISQMIETVTAQMDRSKLLKLELKEDLEDLMYSLEEVLHQIEVELRYLGEES